jgi:GTPase SAR1 family protein
LEVQLVTPIPVQNKKQGVEGVDLVIWNTPGSDDWMPMNPAVDHGSDVVIYVASYDSRKSLKDLSTIWVPRLSE